VPYKTFKLGISKVGQGGSEWIISLRLCGFVEKIYHAKTHKTPLRREGFFFATLRLCEITERYSTPHPYAHQNAVAETMASNLVLRQ